MKKIISVLFLFIICVNVCKAEAEFITIDSVEATIGNDKFKAKLKAFTGVAGERNEEDVKYYRKEHKVNLSEYSIKKYLITNKDYQNFLKETKYLTTYAQEKNTEYKQELKLDNYPVKRISFIDAVAYCQWYSDKMGEIYRLPTSAEWEYAALANTKRIFPWGDESKVLISTKTDSVIGRENFSIYQILEDISPIGMANLMGGVEYTLDCYDERFYENSPIENPVCLIPYNADCVMRGISEYNNLENDVYGLYDLTWAGFNDYSSYLYFRIVKSDNTVFNKGTVDEAYYCPLKGVASSVNLYKHPEKTDKFENYDVNSNLYILFRSTDSKFYRCTFETKDENRSAFFNKDCYVWKTGWVESTQITLINKKWYQN